MKLILDKIFLLFASLLAFKPLTIEAVQKVANLYASPRRIAVVDINEARAPYLDEAVQLLNKKRKELHAYYTVEEKELRSTYETLSEQQDKVGKINQKPSLELKGKINNFEKKAQAIQKKSEDDLLELRKKHLERIKKINAALEEALEEVAETLKLDLILAKDKVLFWKKTHDLTPLIKEKLLTKIAKTVQ